MKNIIITILTIIVLCLGGYLVFDKVIDKNNNDIEEESKEKDNIGKEDINKDDGDYNLTEAQELMNIYVDTKWGSEIFDGLNNDLKLKIAYRNLNYSTYPETIPYEDLNKIYKELFGGAEATKNDFMPGEWCKTYKYNSQQNKYVYNESQGCGGARWYEDYSIKSATVKDSKLDIIVYYYEIDPSMGNLYRRNQEESLDVDKYKIADLTNSERTSDYKLTDAAFEKYKDKMDTFTFRFEKYNDSYILKDVFKN